MSHEWEQLNKSKPLWMRKREDVTNEKNLVKQCLEMCAEIAKKKKDVYKQFYEQFGKRMKLGVQMNF